MKKIVHKTLIAAGLLTLFSASAAASETLTVGATPVPHAEILEFVKPELAKNPAVFPDEAALARMIAPGVPDQATRKLITRTFTNFKAGR